jgi:prepilin peptidase CpaA
MHSFEWQVEWWPTLVAVLIATVTDLRSRRIPNWLVFPFLITGFAVSGWLNGWHGVAHSAEGMALAFLVFGVFFWLGGMGAGDVKLAAAIGAWIGPQQTMIALVLIALAGGVMALGWALAGGFATELFQETGNLILGRKKQAGDDNPTLPDMARSAMRRKMPYAPAIAIGTLLSFFSR